MYSVLLAWRYLCTVWTSTNILLSTYNTDCVYSTTSGLTDTCYNQPLCNHVECVLWTAFYWYISLIFVYLSSIILAVNRSRRGEDSSEVMTRVWFGVPADLPWLAWRLNCLQWRLIQMADVKENKLEMWVRVRNDMLSKGMILKIAGVARKLWLESQLKKNQGISK